MARTDPENEHAAKKCTCKCINAFPPLPGDPSGLKRGCKDGIHCGRKERGCGFKRGDAW